MTPEGLKSIMQKYIDEEVVNIAEHEIIKEILIKNNGKPLNKRIKLPEGLTLDVRFGMYHIDGIQTHLVSYDGIIDAEKFEHHDNCCGNAAKERIAQLNAILSSEKFDKLLELVNRIETAYHELTAAFGEMKNGEFRHFKNPAYYSILKSFMKEEHFRAF